MPKDTKIEGSVDRQKERRMKQTNNNIKARNTVQRCDLKQNVTPH